MKSKIILIVFLLLISIMLGIFRWDKDSFITGDMEYKVDRWTGQQWVEFYPPNALVTKPFEYPVFGEAKYSSNEEMAEIIKDRTLNGDLIDPWLLRMRITHIYYGFNIGLVLLLLYSVMLFFKEKKR
ncbi:hypothetical protein [Paenibacillus kobensis]|uniref:hypothetical protein n=1 Tax=Paenibacillus kobensis TaxID=59841 RepID=UPI000FDA114C|nr:hypothetical protein [Paenibacillus kobensis]